MSTRAEILALVLLAILATLAPPDGLTQPLQILQAQDVMQAQSGGRQPLVTPTLLDDNRVPRDDNPPMLTVKQEHSLLRANFERSKKDAAILATLARQLREELDKPNANVFSPECMNRLDKIEKLAKKIRDETKGF